LAAACRSTEHFKQHSSPVPLVWVLTEDGWIPDSAVPFGEDRDRSTLYIACALWKGIFHIGKASPQLARAVIGYAGKEHIISNYEVLVCTSQLCWGFSSAVEAKGVLTQDTVVLAQQHLFNTTLVESDIPQFIPDLSDIDREASLKRLACITPQDEIKTVIIVNDLLSMQDGNLWAQAWEALAGIVDIANQYRSKGADIHFMHIDEYASNMQVVVFSRIIRTSIDSVVVLTHSPDEDTPTGMKLGQIINHYLPLSECEHSTHELITAIVITNGLPTDQVDLESVIIDAAHRLKCHHIKHDMFRIQFVQIGTDPAASELLHTLDDHLMTHYKIRDIIDSTPYDPRQGAFDTEYMLKILLGD
ncbi:hypothetical protein HD554DRAFT_1981336, partial [Boletus coccyginus]